VFVEEHPLAIILPEQLFGKPAEMKPGQENTRRTVEPGEIIIVARNADMLGQSVVIWFECSRFQWELL
jgi:hypothetical protein